MQETTENDTESPAEEAVPELTEAQRDREAEEQNEQDAANEAEERARAAAQPSSERAVRNLEKKITAERERHANRLGDILGDASADVLPCPLCFDGLHGFVLPGDAQTLSDEQRGAALAFLGAEGPSELLPRPGYRQCDACNGHGEWANPTKVAHYLTTQCTVCGGQGYVPERPAVQPPQLAAVDAFTAAATPNGEAPPCPLCGALNSQGKPHFCNPVGAGMSS